jgi:hypothetical protein
VPRSRPLATHLAVSHGLIGLFACLTVGVILALLLPEFYLRQREAGLVAEGRALAADVAPTLAREGTVPAVAIDSPEAGMVMVVDAQQQVVAMSAPRGGGGGRGGGGAAAWGWAEGNWRAPVRSGGSTGLRFSRAE